MQNLAGVSEHMGEDWDPPQSICGASWRGIALKQGEGQVMEKEEGQCLICARIEPQHL